MTLSDPDALRQAAAVAVDAASALAPSTLDDPTPCTDFAVAELFRHLAWSPVLLAAAGARETVDADWTATPPYLAELPVEEWPAAFATQVEKGVAAWADASAWEGDSVFGSSPMPAVMIGRMMTAEFATHGWDLARALGRDVVVSPELGESVLGTTDGMAQMGRDGGWYGPEVTVPEDAPAFDRALGRAGRDPGWKA